MTDTTREAPASLEKRAAALRVPIAATYPLTAFREAVAHVQRGGKVMFDVNGAI
jgi:hypothetical protein